MQNLKDCKTASEAEPELKPETETDIAQSVSLRTLLNLSIRRRPVRRWQHLLAFALRID